MALPRDDAAALKPQKQPQLDLDKDTPAKRECGLHALGVAVSSGVISGLTIGQAQYAFGTFVDPLAEEFPSWSRVDINIALSIGMVVNGLMAPPTGMIMDRLGIRVVVPLAALICSSGWLCIAYTESLSVLYLGFTLVYCSFPANTMQQGGKLVGAWFPRSRSKVMGFVAAGNNTGGVLMVLLISRVPWRTGAFIFAALQAAAALMYFVVVRDTPPSASRSPVPEKVLANTVSAKDEAPQKETLKSPFRTGRFLGVVFALSFCFYTYAGVLTQLQPALVADGVDVDTAAWCMTIVGALGIASKICSGMLAHKIGAKRTMQVSLVLQEVAMLLLVLHGTLPMHSRPLALAFAAASVYGLAFGAVGALIPLVILEEYDVKIFGKAAGLVGLGFMGSGLVAPVVAGAFFDGTGQYTGSFIVTAGVFAVAFIAFEILCRTAQRSTQSTTKPELQTLEGKDEATLCNSSDTAVVKSTGTTAEVCDTCEI